jgi:phage tail-like protein
MAIGERVDPYRAFNFRVEIDGITVGNFSEVTGLTTEVDAVTYREGTDFPLTLRELPGLFKQSNIVLKNGYTGNGELWAWYRNITLGIPDRRGVAIVLMDEQRNDVMRWNAENAWIRKIEGPAFRATANEIAMLSCELIHEGITLEG